jgi:hypothetical protein
LLIPTGSLMRSLGSFINNKEFSLINLWNNGLKGWILLQVVNLYALILLLFTPCYQHLVQIFYKSILARSEDLHLPS